MGRSRGASLLELMVALCFTGMLLAGMVRVYLAALDGWVRVNEGLAAQRALGWAMARIQEDLQMAGHLFPPAPWRAPMPGAEALLPGQAEDELCMVMDAPLPVRAELGAAIPAPPAPAEEVPAAAGPVLVRPDRPVSLAAGDLLLVEGEWFECVRLGHPAELGGRRVQPLRVVRADGRSGAPFAFAHPAGAPVQVVRPLRRVRYAVVPSARTVGRHTRDPGEPAPCLVRFESSMGDEPKGPGEVVAENVDRFRVDGLPGSRGAWGVVRVRLEIRGPVARADRAAAGAGASRRFPVRGQTLAVSPRNSGL